jgi:hypothetical protein
MLQFGIFTFEQVKNSKNLIAPRANHQAKISISLYDKITSLPNFDEIAEAILMLYVDENSAFKRTYSNRFNSFDEAVMRYAVDHFSNTSETLQIHDMAVSDGRTSIDFFQRLAPQFENLEYYASDFDGTVKVVEYGNKIIILNRNDKVVELVIPPFVFNCYRLNSWKHYPLNNLIFYYCKAFIIPCVLKLYGDGLIPVNREIPIFCPAALKLSLSDTRFRLLAFNILDPHPFAVKQHIIRAMNVLNPSYFDESKTKQIVTHVLDGLVNGGLFILGSNQNSGSIVNGGIYQKVCDRFVLLWQSGSGASAHALIVEIRA